MLSKYNYLRIWEIWKAGKNGLELNEEDARFYEVMEHHMQYARVWDHLADASEKDVLVDGVDVVLHVIFHQIIENQRTEDNPPAVRQVLRLLMQKGLKEHDAVHAIASVVAWEVYDMLQKERLFDETRYVRELRKLPLKVKSPARKKKDRG